jgi:hypothetical protein
MAEDIGNRTWLYLRTAMILLVIGLAASLGYEHWAHDPGCLLGSISAFYYTPVRAVFVAILVAVAVCLICVRGSTPEEDVLLTLAGGFAPIVAFVPTPKPNSCAAILVTNQGVNADVANNLLALLVVSGCALAVASWIVWRGFADMTLREQSAVGVGLALAWVAWILLVIFDATNRTGVVASAHYPAAIAMFVCIILATVANAVDRKRKWDWSVLGDRYMLLAIVMVLVVIAGVIGHFGFDWKHWVLFTEIGLISSFAVLWTLQTHELGGGLRRNG